MTDLNQPMLDYAASRQGVDVRMQWLQADALARRVLQAGFAHIQRETLEQVSRAGSAREAATAYCHGTPLRNEIEARDASLLALATDRATEAIARRFGTGPVAGKIQAHVVVARA